MVDGVPEHQHRQDRPRQRQHDLGEEAEVRAAVDLGRFGELPGKVGEIGPGDDRVPDRQPGGEDHRPARVDQAQRVDQQEGGHDASPEEHRYEDEDADDGEPAQVLAGQGVGQKHGQHQVERGAGDHVEQAVEEAGEDQLVAEDALVAHQREAARIDGDVAGQNVVGARQGGGDHVQHGDDDDQSHGDQQQRVEEVEHAFAGDGVTPRLAQRAAKPGYHRLIPDSLLLSRLADTMRTRFSAPLNRSTAAPKL